MATAEQAVLSLLTAEEFSRRPDPGHPEELVKGTIIAMPPPGIRHGDICAQFAFFLRLYLNDQDLGRVLSNDTGVITERGPDSVRGPDVSFYSYARLPRGPLPSGYAGVAPDLVCEVLSPDDRWPRVLAKVAEYLNAGVTVVLVLHPEHRTVSLYDAEQPGRTLGPDDELIIPAVFPEFRVAVARLFV